MIDKKVVYIAHPVRGNVRENIDKILQICRETHLSGVIPIAAYVTMFQYLDDSIPEERELGMEADGVLFERRAFDELWLFGDYISEGMKAEIFLALQLDIPVVPKTPETEKGMKDLHP
jgi:predicted metal-dependent TIM-barrel fold hydrolase